MKRFITDRRMEVSPILEEKFIFFLICSFYLDYEKSKSHQFDPRKQLDVNKIWMTLKYFFKSKFVNIFWWYPAYLVTCKYKLNYILKFSNFMQTIFISRRDECFETTILEIAKTPFRCSQFVNPFNRHWM